MNQKKPVMFDDALEIARQTIKERQAVSVVPAVSEKEKNKKIIIVRDLRGRIRLLLPGNAGDLSSDQASTLDSLKKALSGSLGAYGFLPADRLVLFAEDLFQGDWASITSEARLLSKEEGLSIYLLDRQIIGQDWMRKPLKDDTPNKRVTFFGIKGGVGRSTALIIWAWAMAKQGKRILILDLDLESPGVSSTLLPKEALPEYGIVDWFVENGVDQDNLLDGGMTATSPLAKELTGEIRVVPAFGRKAGDYLSKLARCYADLTGESGVAWAERLKRMVEHLEQEEKPDLVIFDSRAGLHDIAAVLVTRMCADVFLFAVDSPQTWAAYSFLFEHWKLHPQVREFRERLHMVAGMIPETGRDEHLKRFREHAWDLFLNIYDDMSISEMPENPFSFDLDDKEAPHYPLPVFWTRALQEFDPVGDTNGMDAQIAHAALGTFIEEAQCMVFPDGAIIND